MIGLDLSPRQYPRLTGDIAPAPLADFFVGGGGQSVALAAGADSALSVWTEIAPNCAACLRFDNDDPGTRYSWRETLVMELRNIYPVGEMVLSGSWSKLQSSGSGLTGSYIGNRAVSTSALGATATVTVDRADPYDVWVYYTGRTNGGYCRVDIDGSQELVTEISDPDGLGFKAFPTFSNTDLQRKQVVKIASGLTGAHEVVITNGGAAVPGGSNILIEAVAITGSLADPRILPPMWQSNGAYEMGDEVQFGGRYYSARANGLSGADGPTHTGGIASDGALDWRVDNRPTYPVFVAADYPSEREYALRFSAGTGSTEVGGQTHGNEPLQSRQVLIDGMTWVPSTMGNGLTVGGQISIVETTQWQYANGDPFGDCTLSRTIDPGSVRHDINVDGTGAEGTFEWFYAGMVPFVRWDGELRRTVFDTLEAPRLAPVNLTDYAGSVAADQTYADVQRIGLTATIEDRSLVYGHEAGATPLSGNRLNAFDVFWRPNITGASESGSQDWQAKAYIRAESEDTLSLSDGDRMAFYSLHVLRMA